MRQINSKAQVSLAVNERMRDSQQRRLSLKFRQVVTKLTMKCDGD